MKYITTVQKIDPFTYLPNKNGACLFSQNIILFNDTFEQFATLNSTVNFRKFYLFFNLKKKNTLIEYDAIDLQL